jgi:hypothetical protein
VDVTVWISFVVGVIPLLFFCIDLIFHDTPEWVSRFETEEFFSSSALLLLSLSLAIHQFETEIKVRYRRIIYLLAALTIISGVSFLFIDHGDLWTSTVVVYNLEGLFVAATFIKFVDEKLFRNLSILLLIAYIFGFAIFINETVFLVGVVLYLISIATIEYLMISQYIFN